MQSRCTPSLTGIALFALTLLVSISSNAQSILIAPGSLVLTDQRRTGEISVANTEGHRISYRVEPVLFRMRADGLLDEVATLDSSAAGLLRFAPRQFELEPGESQVVRVAYRATADLAPGEYRLHLRMRNMGSPVLATAPAPAPAGAAITGEISLQIPITVARAARILVRHQVGPGSVTLNAFTATRIAPDLLQVDLSLLNRRDGGSASGLMRFVVDGRAPMVDAKPVQRRYSVYADLDRRDYQVLLPVAAGQPVQLCVDLIPDGSTAGAAPEQHRCESG